MKGCIRFLVTSQRIKIKKYLQPSLSRVLKHKCSNPGSIHFSRCQLFALSHQFRSTFFLQSFVSSFFMACCETHGTVISRYPSLFIQDVVRISRSSLNVHLSNRGSCHVSFGLGFMRLFLRGSGHSWFLGQRLQIQVKTLVYIKYYIQYI